MATKKTAKRSREELAALRLAEVIGAGFVVTFEGAWGRGTVGPYQSALGPASFAVFIDRGSPRNGVFAGRREYASAYAAASSVVGLIGVSDTIEALKSLRNKGLSYAGLDSPMVRPVSTARSNPPKLHFHRRASGYAAFTAADWKKAEELARLLAHGEGYGEAVIEQKFSDGYYTMGFNDEDGVYLEDRHGSDRLPHRDWPKQVRTKASKRAPGTKRTRKVNQRSNPKRPRATTGRKGR